MQNIAEKNSAENIAEMPFFFILRKPLMSVVLQYIVAI